jgi:hypothetical protein
MDSTESTEYRISDVMSDVRDVPRHMALVRVDRPKALRRHEHRRALERALERDTHGLVLHVTDDGVMGQMFADWWYDLRRGQLRIYGGLLRFLDLASKKAPRRVLQMIPGWIRAYIDDLYDGGDDDSAAAA